MKQLFWASPVYLPGLPDVKTDLDSRTFRQLFMGNIGKKAYTMRQVLSLKAGCTMADAEEYDVVTLRQTMLAYLGKSSDAYPAHIERQFPRILAKFVELWGTPPMDAYLQNLMVSDRPSRQGFPSEVAAEIFRLSIVHGALGVTKEAATMGWASVSDGEIAKLFEKPSR